MNAAWLALRTSTPVANRLALLGDRVPAQELHRLGLATEVVDDDAVVARAEELAAELAGHPPGAARAIKASLRTHRDVDTEAWFTSSDESGLLQVGFVGD